MELSFGRKNILGGEQEKRAEMEMSMMFWGMTGLA